MSDGLDLALERARAHRDGAGRVAPGADELALLSELPNMMREIHSDPHDQPLYSTQNVKEPAANKPADGVLNIVPYQPDGAGQSREEPCREELGPNEPGQREPAADASDGSEEQAGPRGGAPEPAA